MSEEDATIAAMMFRRTVDARKSLKMTLLHRSGGTWSSIDYERLKNLALQIQMHPGFPEHVILYGHHTKAEILAALWGGLAFTATQITGYDDERLPWKPTGWVE